MMDFERPAKVDSFIPVRVDFSVIFQHSTFTTKINQEDLSIL